MIFLLTLFTLACFFLFVAGMIWSIGAIFALAKWGLIALVIFVIGKVLYDAIF